MLKDESDLEEFLNFYIDSNIKYRQLSRATLKLISSIEKDQHKLPVKFYKHYGEVLENYLVDNQTLINLWTDLIQILNEKSSGIFLD